MCVQALVYILEYMCQDQRPNFRSCVGNSSYQTGWQVSFPAAHFRTLNSKSFRTDKNKQYLDPLKDNAEFISHHYKVLTRDGWGTMSLN